MKNEEIEEIKGEDVTVFIGLRAMKLGDADNSNKGWRAAAVIHINPSFIKLVNEKTMTLVMDDGSEYRIDDESLQVFLSSLYGEDKVRGDKLSE